VNEYIGLEFIDIVFQNSLQGYDVFSQPFESCYDQFLPNQSKSLS
jgi:hypothetical protein